jgi:hypothetical protein
MTRLRSSSLWASIGKSCLCRGGVGSDAEVVEEGLRVDAEGFVVAVDLGPGVRLRPRRGPRTPAKMGVMTCSPG